MRTHNDSFIKYGIRPCGDGLYRGYIGGIDRSGWEPIPWGMCTPTKTTSKGEALLEAKKYYDEWIKQGV